MWDGGSVLLGGMVEKPMRNHKFLNGSGRGAPYIWVDAEAWVLLCPSARSDVARDCENGFFIISGLLLTEWEIRWGCALLEAGLPDQKVAFVAWFVCALIG